MTDDESPGLGLDLPQAAPPPPVAATATPNATSSAPASSAPYRVLARKYRPQTFSELIGQDAMVRTLANAIDRGRIAHAFLLTGVRGVGKTSTARLVAKALNCVGLDGTGGPTIAPCGGCEHCVAIAEGRHIDVIEMDAASHTGVDDVREIIEAVRYASVSARYKIYIIDEVHMLSKNAFNALLKTLEEPPEHVKFLFATTEVAKVPVTVLSRCQRFDLRRIPAEKLIDHFAGIARVELVEAEPEALALIARAAEGSARDGLSIMDQAIALGSGTVTAAQVRDMLGLADRGRIRRLLHLVLTGDAPQVLAELDDVHALGTDAASLLRGLMEELHVATRAKAGASTDKLQSAEQRQAAEELAQLLSWGDIHRLWQMLLKGLADVQIAPDPQEAATMALLRLIHAADLPDPATILSKLSDGTAVGAHSRARTGEGRPAAPTQAKAAEDFPALIRQLEAAGHHRLGLQLHDHVGLVRFAPGELVLRPLKPLGPDFARELIAAAKSATGMAWTVNLREQGGEPSLREKEAMAEERVRSEVLSEPNVQAVLEAFPEAALETFAHGDPLERKGA
jgi:DNA polymerase-3 subunit gamma/tau